MSGDADFRRIIDQRIFIDREQLLEIEQRIRLQRHIERYALLRQFAQGVVCDAACGCGYGSYLLATNPDVKAVIGVDGDADAIAHARKEFGTRKTEFYVADLAEWVCPRRIDMVISVETIEHMTDQYTLPKFVERNDARRVILTYPSKKTTHYNRYHHHDFKLSEVLGLFPGFTCSQHFNWEYEFDVVFLVKGAF